MYHRLSYYMRFSYRNYTYDPSRDSHTDGNLKHSIQYIHGRESGKYLYQGWHSSRYQEMTRSTQSFPLTELQLRRWQGWTYRYEHIDLSNEKESKLVSILPWVSLTHRYMGIVDVAYTYSMETLAFSKQKLPSFLKGISCTSGLLYLQEWYEDYIATFFGTPFTPSKNASKSSWSISSTERRWVAIFSWRSLFPVMIFRARA